LRYFIVLFADYRFGQLSVFFDLFLDLSGHPPDTIDEAFKFDIDTDALNLFGLSLDFLPLPHHLTQIGVIIVRIAADATYLLFKRVKSDDRLRVLGRHSHAKQGLLQLISEASSRVREGLGLGGLGERLGHHNYRRCIVKVRGPLGMGLPGLRVRRPDHAALLLLLGRT
jgi:hypothetical protein